MKKYTYFYSCELLPSLEMVVDANDRDEADGELLRIHSEILSKYSLILPSIETFKIKKII